MNLAASSRKRRLEEDKRTVGISAKKSVKSPVVDNRKRARVSSLPDVAVRPSRAPAPKRKPNPLAAAAAAAGAKTVVASADDVVSILLSHKKTLVAPSPPAAPMVAESKHEAEVEEAVPAEPYVFFDSRLEEKPVQYRLPMSPAPGGGAISAGTMDVDPFPAIASPVPLVSIDWKSMELESPPTFQRVDPLDPRIPALHQMVVTALGSEFFMPLPCTLDYTFLNRIVSKSLTLVTYKSDGERKYLLICSEGWFLVNRAFDFDEMFGIPRDYQMYVRSSWPEVGLGRAFTLIDGELLRTEYRAQPKQAPVVPVIVEVNGKDEKKEDLPTSAVAAAAAAPASPPSSRALTVFQCHDLIMLNGVSVIETPFEERYRMFNDMVTGMNTEWRAEHVANSSMPIVPFRLISKLFVPLANLRSEIVSHFQYLPRQHEFEVLLDEISSFDVFFDDPRLSCAIHCDGLFFQEMLAAFNIKNNPMACMKLKFKDSLDFIITKVSGSNYVMHCLIDSERTALCTFVDRNVKGLVPPRLRSEIDEAIQQGIYPVVEVEYDIGKIKNSRWYICRMRPDKKFKPNAWMTTLSTCLRMKDNIRLETVLDAIDSVRRGGSVSAAGTVAVASSRGRSTSGGSASGRGRGGAGAAGTRSNRGGRGSVGKGLSALASGGTPGAQRPHVPISKSSRGRGGSMRRGRGGLVPAVRSSPAPPSPATPVPVPVLSVSEQIMAAA